MTVKTALTAILTEALQPAHLEVVDESHLHAGHSGSRAGGETHFRVRVVADAFNGRSRLDRHRMVNDLLAAHLAPGGVHALAIEARGSAEEAAGR